MLVLFMYIHIVQLICYNWEKKKSMYTKKKSQSDNISGFKWPIYITIYTKVEIGIFFFIFIFIFIFSFGFLE